MEKVALDEGAEMASGQLLAAKAKGVEPTWEVGPTQDVVQALMETLVDPLLPLKLSNVPPSDDAQKSVAKQMHAVVLLYNYHHRKQKPDLELLDFVRFCNVAMLVRPPLTAFMKLMMEGESIELNDAENQLSVTEKAIKEACDIAVALDASRDFPDTEGWPISKVAVLLIDSKKENCMLRFGGVTEGVWSLIEKEINDCSINTQELLSEEKVGNKRKQNDQKNSTHETDEFLQLEFDAVKDITGIDSSDLKVLESHITYSSCKEKSAALFYMMQCPGSFSLKEQVSLEFLVKSLHGPLAEEVEHGLWKTTPVVEFHHMLPYVELISCWLLNLRKDLCLPSSNSFDGQSTTKSCEKELTQSITLDLPLSKNNDDLDRIDNISHGKKVKSSEKIDNENCDGNNECQHSSNSDVTSLVRFNLETTETDGGDQQLVSASGFAKGMFQKTVIDDNVIEKFSTDHEIAHSPKKDKDSVERDKDPLSDPLRGLETMKMSNLTKDCTKNEDKSKMLNSKLRVYHLRRKNKSSTQNDTHVREDNAGLRKEGVAMASGPLLEAKAKGVEPTWEVGPTEDVVQALMETLVDPFLPLRVSNVTPSEDAQNSVAKQIHAVVLLYNYHHRKQKPDLVFLNFVRFCKVAMVVRPPLTAFMKLMMEGESIELIDVENQLSITEKAIMEACDIALALDASRHFPNTEGWPISKVAVLLIDSIKENCMLWFGGITVGVWSLIEKEINKNNQELLSEEKVGNKRRRSDQKNSTHDIDEFLQLGFDAVKDITGIVSSDLEVLESHVTFSLSKEKSATLLYMMQCPGSFSAKEKVSLEFLVKSLHGPLAEKGDYGLWKTTPVVEFHRVLPYVELILSWLPRKDLCSPSLSSCNAQSATKRCKKELTQSSTLDLPLSKYNGDDLNHINNISPTKKVDYSGKIDGENCDSNNMCKDCNVVSPSRGLPGETVIDDNVIEKFNSNHEIAHSSKEAESRIYPESSDKDDVEGGKDPLSDPLRGLETMNMSNLTKDCTKSDDTSMKLSSKLSVYHHGRKDSSSTQNEAHVCGYSAYLRVDMLDSWNLDHTLSTDEKVSEVKGDVTMSCNQSGVAAEGKQLVLLEPKTNYSTDVQISTSEEVQNALALLYRKRGELYYQICNMEDTIALCEDNISRIRDGGDVGLARQCIKSILSGNYHMLPEHGPQNYEKQTRLTEIYLPGKSSCQDLEYICLMNNWRLPKYLIESSSDGKFISRVFVEGRDFKLHSKGGFESKPCEARESAAANMIASIRNS